MKTVRDDAISEDDRLKRLDQRLADAHLEGHWRLADAARSEPAAFAPPHLWDWRELRALLVEAGELASIEGVSGRRTVRLCTPGLNAKWATPTIHASVQLVKPGEVAAAHRHTLSALRFVIEGSGGYTTVDGAKLRMEPGDLILTPQWTWHDHGHEGDRPMIWIDGHDVPFSGYLNAIFFEGYKELQQEVTISDDLAQRRIGALRPFGVAPLPGGQPYVYKGNDAIALLRALGDEARDPCFGITLTYMDPLTGGSTLPTMSCRLSRLDAGEETTLHRRTANLIYHVVSGSGVTLAGDRELAWREGDLFVVPGWTWHQHQAQSANAVLFSMSDEPIANAFGLLRVQTKEA
jgi:gentisate 1,2-dioxygenase